MTTPSPDLVVRLTREEIEQIIEGIEHFIIDGDPEVNAIWQPYIDKLRAALAAQPEPRA